MGWRHPPIVFMNMKIISSYTKYLVKISLAGKFKYITFFNLGISNIFINKESYILDWEMGIMLALKD